MDSNFTQDLTKLEEYSLAMIDFIEGLPDAFFDSEELKPSPRVVDNIMTYSKNKSSNLRVDNKLYRFNSN